VARVRACDGTRCSCVCSVERTDLGPGRRQDRRAAGVDRRTRRFRQEAEARIRPVARAGQRGRRHLRGRQEVQGRARHLRLPDRRQARRRTRREAHQRGQGLVHDRAVRLGTHEDHRRRRRALRRADRRGRLLRGSARPGLQASIRHAGAVERPDRRDAREVQSDQARPAVDRNPRPRGRVPQADGRPDEGCRRLLLCAK
jgi:hypothetical protein